MRPMGLVAAAVAVALLAAGCGGPGGREDAAAAVAIRLLDAVDDRDGAGACATLAPETLADLEKSADQPCDQAILDEDLPGPSGVTTTNVYGQWAQVRLQTDTLFLAVFPGGWKVVAAGCRSRGDRPYDCTLQGG
ncbi:hypothetical protein O7635_23565 [Asanoa sp. WMMD1127]|uniref:hypothetical protein n=1 Tax=Asanoa sp. WMMD1127 TaxID=3016107 RepID=UPI0024163979|nr:hypothetical protein [Asanoa sp. WMMD1127]MDG4824838.1 hypothetical protein [Asanoa sp. WMMD1127]